MDDRKPDELAERYRAKYLELKSVLHDRTTGLPSYPLLMEVLRSRLETRRRVGVLHVEAANLDLVESIYGWQVFDRVVSRISEALRGMLGSELPPETLLALNGVAGDRFLAFVVEAPGGGEVDAELLARSGALVALRLEEAFADEDYASLSPGLSFRVGHSFLSEDPFYRFERRIYAAVEEARTMPERRLRRRERLWGAELRRILREAAISTVFQPIVDLETLEVLGYEALARGPQGSDLERPSTMFELSSRLGRSADLDRLCRTVALRESGAVLGRSKLFLNILGVSLSDPDATLESVRRDLGSTVLDPGDVVLEVSERNVEGDLDRLATALVAVKERGFGLALDDVGTGYASLATLERVWPDFLKVDVSLVRGIHENFIKQELLASFVHIGQRLGAEVIAEGVESEAEAEALRAAGARYGQGYLFATPGPIPVVPSSEAGGGDA